MSTNTEMNVSKIHVEEEYVCCKCETEGWGDENGSLNEDGDFTCEECVEKEDDDVELFECIRCKKGGFTENDGNADDNGFMCEKCFDEYNDEPYIVVCECCENVVWMLCEWCVSGLLVVCAAPHG